MLQWARTPICARHIALTETSTENLIAAEIVLARITIYADLFLSILIQIEREALSKAWELWREISICRQNEASTLCTSLVVNIIT